MLMMAQMLESNGSQNILVITRAQKKYSVNIPMSHPTHRYPKQGDFVIVEIGSSRSHANFICMAENAVYLIKDTQLDSSKPQGYNKRRTEGKTRIVKFVDQDILFSWLVDQYDLNEHMFLWNDRSVAFCDPKRTVIHFHVVEMEEIKKKS